MDDEWVELHGFYFHYRLNRAGILQKQSMNGSWVRIVPDVRGGIPYVHMTLGGEKRTGKRDVNLAFLMADTFWGGIGGKETLVFSNGNPEDCSLANLRTERWRSPGHGMRPGRKLRVDKVDAEGNILATYRSLEEAAEANGIPMWDAHNQVFNIRKRAIEKWGFRLQFSEAVFPCLDLPRNAEPALEVDSDGEWVEIPGYRYRYRINRSGQVQMLLYGKWTPAPAKLYGKTLAIRMQAKLPNGKYLIRQEPLAYLMADTFWGGIRNGHTILFRNQDPTDCSLDNLYTEPWKGPGHGSHPVMTMRVQMLGPDGTPLAVYRSVAEASEMTEVSELTIRQQCRFQRPSKSAFSFRYVDEICPCSTPRDTRHDGKEDVL